MAKSARASVRKRNNATLRAKVFGPAFDARTERLSAKLQEIANTPRPEEEKAMDVDDQKDEEKKAGPTDSETKGQLSPPACVNHELTFALDEEMQYTLTNKPSRKAEQRRVAGQRQKKVGKRKARSQMVFPSELARRKRQAKAKKG